MRMTKKVLALTLTLALAAPAAAFGQSAGDEQYSDPFQNEPSEPQGAPGNSGAQGNSGNSGSSGDDQGVDPAAPQVDLQAPEGTTSANPDETSGATVGEGGPALPRTGLPAAALALIGIFLLAGGSILKRTA
jgi:hypothetical protein